MLGHGKEIIALLQGAPHGAVISTCQRYRYVLWRTVAEVKSQSAPCVFVMLNPSTAAAAVESNDATLRRCTGYARSWGYERLVVVNLFAYRATLPKELKAVVDPVGPENDRWLAEAMAIAGIRVCAWGPNGAFQGRDRSFRQAHPHGLYCLKKTKDGFPSHPLRLLADLKPSLYREEVFI